MYVGVCCQGFEDVHAVVWRSARKENAELASTRKSSVQEVQLLGTK